MKNRFKIDGAFWLELQWCDPDTAEILEETVELESDLLLQGGAVRSLIAKFKSSRRPTSSTRVFKRRRRKHAPDAEEVKKPEAVQGDQQSGELLVFLGAFFVVVFLLLCCFPFVFRASTTPKQNQTNTHNIKIKQNTGLQDDRLAEAAPGRDGIQQGQLGGEEPRSIDATSPASG